LEWTCTTHIGGAERARAIILPTLYINDYVRRGRQMRTHTLAADTYTTWISEDWSRVHMRGCCGVSPGWCFNEAHLSLVSKHLICFFLLRIFILWLSEL